MTPDEKALARAVDAIAFVDPKRIDRARRGEADSAHVGIPWVRFVELVDAIEATRPGWIEATREVLERKLGRKPWQRAGRR